MRAELYKKSFVLSGHATSVALEQPFWDMLGRAAAAENLSLHGFIARLDNANPEVPLTRKLRLAALSFAAGTIA